MTGVEGGEITISLGLYRRFGTVKLVDTETSMIRESNLVRREMK